MSGPSSIPSAPVKPGDVLAEKYEVERVLGVGGMGVVVSAHHVHLKQRVALKFLLPALSANSNVVARFLREAQHASTIRSEHVVRVSDVGVLATGAPYMVMEYLEGNDLSALLAARGRLPVTETVDYVLQAMEALAEAHQAGIVHRDLKPSNLFLTERADGSSLIKVLDFGISKITKSDGDESAKSLTSTAGLMGSPLYMSPEQIRSSKNVDARADVWSLGVIVYELLSGTSPFYAEEVNAILAAVVADDPAALRSLRSDVPRELEAVVMKCLSKRPEARYPTVGALARDLGPFGSQAANLSVERVLGVTARSNPTAASLEATMQSAVTPGGATAGAWTQRATEYESPKKHRRLIVAGVAFLCVAVATGVALFSKSPKAPAVAGAAPTQPPRAPLAVPPPAPRTPVPKVPDPEPAVAAASLDTLPIAPSATMRRPSTKKPPAPLATKAPPKPEKKPPSANVDDMIDERR